MSKPASPKELPPDRASWVLLVEDVLYFVLGAAAIVYAWRPTILWVVNTWERQDHISLGLAGAAVIAGLVISVLLSRRIGLLRSVAIFVLAVGVIVFLVTDFGVQLQAR